MFCVFFALDFWARNFQSKVVFWSFASEIWSYASSFWSLVLIFWSLSIQVFPKWFKTHNKHDKLKLHSSQNYPMWCGTKIRKHHWEPVVLIHNCFILCGKSSDHKKLVLNKLFLLWAHQNEKMHKTLPLLFGTPASIHLNLSWEDFLPSSGNSEAFCPIQVSHHFSHMSIVPHVSLPFPLLPELNGIDGGIVGYIVALRFQEVQDVCNLAAKLWGVVPQVDL